jgi:hypothetical protein
MATQPEQDKPKPQIVDDRHVFGPRSISALLGPLLRPAFRKRAPATAQLLADWDAVIGPALAAVTTPRKLTGGTLTLACAGPVAMELQYLAPALMQRINAHLGQNAVARLKFVQDLALPRPILPTPKPAIEAGYSAVADLPEGELREALARLGAMVLRPR